MHYVYYHILFESLVMNKGWAHHSGRSERTTLSDEGSRLKYIWHSKGARIRVLGKENSPDDAKIWILDDELSQEKGVIANRYLKMREM